MFDSIHQTLRIDQEAVTATIGHFGSPRLGWSASAGGIVDGRIDHRDVSGGGTVNGTLSYLPVYEAPDHPFVAVSGTLSASYVQATGDDEMDHGWTAFDLRVGGTVGKTFAQRWVPYATARVFGGMAYWTIDGQSERGGDRYHYTVGAGLIVRLPDNFDITLEAMPLGERSTAFGLTRHL